MKKAIAVILSTILALSMVACGGSNEDGYTPQPDISEIEYKQRCNYIEYEVLERNPESHKGEFLLFTGEVFQVIELDGGVNLMMGVYEEYEGNEAEYYNDVIYVVLPMEEGSDRILEGDMISIFGICAGLHSYETIRGDQASLPRIDAAYYQFEN